MFRTSLLALVLMAAAPAGVATAGTVKDAEIEAKVAALMSRMTLEEKVGQLVQYSSSELLTGPRLGQNPTLSELKAGRVGSLLNVVGAKATRNLQEIAVKESRLGIPVLFGLDVIHGFRTIFPINLGQAASWDMEAIEEAERIAATEASASGIHWTFAPMVDIARDPRWGRVAEGAGEDPFLGSAVAKARIRGFQGNLDQPTNILACVKHFAAYGAAQAGRDYWTTDVPEITLRDVYLPPFKAAVDAGAATFMCAFNDLNGVPCSANAFLLDRVLRKEWGFKGFVVSDWGSIAELIPHGIAANDREAALLAYRAGVDMDMEGRAYMKHLPELIRSGTVDSARLDAAVKAILTAKARLGLFENPYRYCDEDREKQAQLRPEYLRAARTLATESCVLLKNEGALPLRAGQKIALVGPLADAAHDMLGSWEARGVPAETRTLKAALEAAAPGRVTFSVGCSIEGNQKAGFAQALEAAKAADVIIAALGESRDHSGEGHSRSSLDLPGVQREFLEALHRTGKPVVLVLFSGRPLALEAVLPHCDALLLGWLPGTMAGPAVTDLLMGSANPSGKLPITFPRNVGQVPIFYAHKQSGRPQPEGPRQQFKSNYLDVANTPAFPFGFGLSYTRFVYRRRELEAKSLAMGGKLGISVELQNAGERDGEEVVQLYVRDLFASVTRPVRELKGFKRVFLRKGETKSLRFELSPADLAFHHQDMRFAPEAGRFEIFVGGDSLAPKAGEFVLQDN
jgi:beta-glucosidase